MPFENQETSADIATRAVSQVVDIDTLQETKANQDEPKTQTVSTIIEVPIEQVFKAYKYRYVVLFVYALLSLVIGITSAVAGPLITTLQKI